MGLELANFAGQVAVGVAQVLDAVHEDPEVIDDDVFVELALDLDGDGVLQLDLAQSLHGNKINVLDDICRLKYQCSPFQIIGVFEIIVRADQ